MNASPSSLLQATFGCRLTILPPLIFLSLAKPSTSTSRPPSKDAMTLRKRLRLMPLWLLLCATGLFAQTQPDINRYTSGNLSLSRLSTAGAQPNYCLQIDSGFHVVWAACASGGGTGTVTSFGASGLSPLFTVSVANPTTTPALSFTLSNFAAHSVFGNNTGSAAAPFVFQPKSTDLADFSPTAPTTSGKVPIFDQPSGTYIPGDPLVQGLVADGSTTAENPVAIGGYDPAVTPGLHRATFINGNPAGTEYGQIVRNIPSGTQTVSVSNFPATQTVSGTVAATQSGTWTVQPGNTANTTAWKVDGSGVTQPVSAASLPLPSGASTAAKQPALGTAGTPSADVITVQGVTSMTALKVDGSAVTQPVSGTVTANAGSGPFPVSDNGGSLTVDNG